MSIKDRGQKYVEILNFLRKEYVAKYGKEATGLADTMLKRKAAEQVDELMKVVPFPETKITDWTKDRPTTGPKADVEKFPKEKKLTPETEGLGSFDKLKKELEEMEKLGQPYKDTSVSDFLSDYFDMPQKAPPKRTITELNNVKLYGDETFEELDIIKQTGEHPRDKKADGGRIGFKFGTGKRSKNVKEVMDEVNKKLGTKTTGGEVKLTVDIPEPPKAQLQKMFDEFNQRFKQKTRESRKEYERLKDEEPEIMAEYDAMWSDEGPVQMSMEDLIEFRSQNPAGQGMFTKAEAIRARLENTIKGVNPGDEDYDWVMETFPKWIDEIEKNPSLADNETVWKELGMIDLPENQRLKVHKDGTVDFQTLKPTHQFKLKEDIKRKLNADGGRNYYNEGTPKEEKSTYEKIGDKVTKYSGIDAMINLYNYLDKLGTPEWTADPFNKRKKIAKPMKPRKNNSKGGLNYLMGM